MFTIFVTMEPQDLKIDRSKLIRPQTYADRKGLTVRAVRYQIQRGELKTEEIDKVLFIRIG